jgi:hypothetical protein
MELRVPAHSRVALTPGAGEGSGVGLALGEGDGLGEGLALGEGLGLGEGLALGEGLGLTLADGLGLGRDAGVSQAQLCIRQVELRSPREEGRHLPSCAGPSFTHVLHSLLTLVPHSPTGMLLGQEQVAEPLLHT